MYAVKWYKDGNEFYRYLPKENPQIQVFDVPGVHVDVSFSQIFCSLPHFCFLFRLLCVSGRRSLLVNFSVDFACPSPASPVGHVTVDSRRRRFTLNVLVASVVV